jgi:hypothetical protein
MRRAVLAGVLLVLCSLVLGATVFREQVAQAAQAILPVKVVNDSSEPVPVSQQGTANVNVTNSSLSVALPAPVTGGGQRLTVDAGQTANVDVITASALVIQFRNGATEIILRHSPGFASARFPGPGPLVLALTRPIAFDAVQCGGPDGSYCGIGWAGNSG